MRVRQKVTKTMRTVFMAHFFCTRPPYSTARAGMDISPTSVAAVICQALSPDPSQVGYGITVLTPLGAPDMKGLSGSRVPPGLQSRPGRSACFCATINVSHGRVSAAFPVCYASGNVAGRQPRNISGMCHDLLGFRPHRRLRPPPLRRHIAVTLPEPNLETADAPTYAGFHILAVSAYRTRVRAPGGVRKALTLTDDRDAGGRRRGRRVRCPLRPSRPRPRSMTWHGPPVSPSPRCRACSTAAVTPAPRSGTGYDGRSPSSATSPTAPPARCRSG